MGQSDRSGHSGEWAVTGLTAVEREQLEKLEVAEGHLACNLGYEETERPDDGRAHNSPTPSVVAVLEHK